MILGHLGAYNFNLGDNIALYNIRNVFEKYQKILLGKTFISEIYGIKILII